MNDEHKNGSTENDDSRARSTPPAILPSANVLSGRAQQLVHTGMLRRTQLLHTEVVCSAGYVYVLFVFRKRDELDWMRHCIDDDIAL
jgi:hypothetical protein